MTEAVLQVAAFACLGVVLGLIAVRLTGASVSRQLKVMRFRRKLRNLHLVIDSWHEQVERRDRQEELRRYLPPAHPSYRHFERPSDEPEAGAAA